MSEKSEFPFEIHSTADEDTLIVIPPNAYTKEGVIAVVYEDEIELKYPEGSITLSPVLRRYMGNILGLETVLIAEHTAEGMQQAYEAKVQREY